MSSSRRLPLLTRYHLPAAYVAPPADTLPPLTAPPCPAMPPLALAYQATTTVVHQTAVYVPPGGHGVAAPIQQRGQRTARPAGLSSSQSPEMLAGRRPIVRRVRSSWEFFENQQGRHRAAPQSENLNAYAERDEPVAEPSNSSELSNAHVFLGIATASGSSQSGRSSHPRRGASDRTTATPVVNVAKAAGSTPQHEARHSGNYGASSRGREQPTSDDQNREPLWRRTGRALRAACSEMHLRSAPPLLTVPSLSVYPHIPLPPHPNAPGPTAIPLARPIPDGAASVTFWRAEIGERVLGAAAYALVEGIDVHDPEAGLHNADARLTVGWYEHEEMALEFAMPGYASTERRVRVEGVTIGDLAREVLAVVTVSRVL